MLKNFERFEKSLEMKIVKNFERSVFFAWKSKTLNDFIQRKYPNDN